MARQTVILQAALVAAVLVACAAALVIVSQKAEATFPGKNGRIAFVSGRPDIDEIYSVRPDGTGLRNETDDQYIDAAPAYSSDGRQLAFASRGDIFVKDVGSTEETRLTNSPELDFQPAFSPDGQKIVYSAHNVHHTTDLYTINADGTGVRKLTDGGSSPDWSPDGSKIAFSSNGELYVINPDGTGLKNLTNSPTVMEFAPSWSPDGTKIAFTYPHPHRKADVYVMKADGTDQKNLTKPARRGKDYAPTFSPDGTKIAYAHYIGRTREHKIKVMNAFDGSGKTNLVTAAVSNRFDLDWQPRPATSG